jgi:arylsulfatase A-like enzyme
LGENDQWSKVSNFEQSVRIPLFIRVHGAAGSGRHTSALWEAVDLLPTLTDLAMQFTVPTCPRELLPSRATMLCTDGKSAAPLLDDPDARAGSASERAFSQVPRGALVQGEPGDVAGERYMGYSLRVASWRYTEWIGFNATRGVANWSAGLVGRELYAEALGPSCRFDTDTHNVADDPAHSALIANLSRLLRTIV